MGIKFGSKGKKTDAKKSVSPQMKQFLEGLLGYAESAKSYYERGFTAKCYSELDTVIWYAENIRDRIKIEHPELRK